MFSTATAQKQHDQYPLSLALQWIHAAAPNTATAGPTARIATASGSGALEPGPAPASVCPASADETSATADAGRTRSIAESEVREEGGIVGVGK